MMLMLGLDEVVRNDWNFIASSLIPLTVPLWDLNIIFHAVVISTSHYRPQLFKITLVRPGVFGFRHPTTRAHKKNTAAEKTIGYLLASNMTTNTADIYQIYSWPRPE